MILIITISILVTWKWQSTAYQEKATNVSILSSNNIKNGSILLNFTKNNISVNNEDTINKEKIHYRKNIYDMGISITTDDCQAFRDNTVLSIRYANTKDYILKEIECPDNNRLQWN